MTVRCEITQVRDGDHGWLCVDYRTFGASRRRLGHFDVRATLSARRAYYVGRIVRLTVAPTDRVVAS